MSDSILEAVTKANNTIVEEEGKATQVVATTSETTTEPVTEEVPEEKEEELKLDKRTTDALGILDLLENPETASEFIRQLATKAGYKLDATSTPSEVKKAVKSAAEVIKEKLGDNYEFLSGPIGDALTEILEQQRAEFQSELQKRDVQVFEANFAKEYAETISNLKINESEAAALNTLCQEQPNYGTVPLKTYLARMLTIVRVEQTQKSERIKTAQKQKENLKNRLPSGTEVTEVQEQTKVDKHGHMTAKEAALMAQKQLQGN
jgi:hypothetical protein